MTKMDPEIRAAARQAVLCWLATTDAEGTPNVSPKEVFVPVSASTVAIADIASGGTVRNLAANPRACLSFVDVFAQKGYKLVGTAFVHAPGSAGYRDLAPQLLAMAGDRFRIRNIIALRVERTALIRAPSYVFVPDVTERDMREQAYRTYGVRPL